jgi:hypothetical protein
VIDALNVKLFLMLIDVYTNRTHFITTHSIPEAVAKTSQIFLQTMRSLLKLAISTIAVVTGGKPIAV